MVFVTDAALKKMFPFGVMVIPRAEGDRSYPAVVGDEYEADDNFRVWDNPFHSREFSRELEESNDGWVAAGSSGKVFLRPLTKEQRVAF